MTDIDEFDAQLEATPVEVEVIQPEKQRMTPTAIDGLVYTNDVAGRLASGESPKDVALELGISEASLRKRMRTAPMKDLLKIEARRILRHLSRRDLGKEKYLGLATAAAVFIDKVDKLENANMDPEGRVLDKTIINQITVLVQGRGNERRSDKEDQRVSEVAISSLPEVPALPEYGPEEDSTSNDGSGNKV